MWSLPHVCPYPVSTCPWLNSWPTFPSFWWHPYKSLMADISLVFNPSSSLLGSLVATLVIASALVQLLYFSSLLWLTKTLSKWSSDNYVSDLYIIHSHHYNHGNSRPTCLTCITCASFSFPSCFCSLPQDFVSSGPGLPPALSPSSPLQSGMGSSENPFGLEWGLIAGLRGFASHGGSILSRGWLAIVAAPGHPRHQRST